MGKRILAKNDTNDVRIAEVTKRIRRGWSNAKLHDWLLSDLDVTETMAKKLIHDAYAQLAQYSDRVVEYARQVQIERLEDLLQQALDNDDHNTALKCLDMINKLFSLYVERQETKIDISDFKFKFADD